MTTLQQHEHLFDLVNDSVMTRTMEGVISYWNHSAEELYGWRKEEAIGRVSHDLLQTQFPKPLEEIESELVSNGLWEGKLVHTTRDGSRVVVESRWAVELKGESEVLVEINTRSTNSAPHIHTDAVNVGGQEPSPASNASKLAKTDKLAANIAKIVLVGGSILCLLILSYFIYYYAWTGQRQFTSPATQFVYFALPGLLAIALFVALRLPVSERFNVALCFASVGLTTYTVEATMTLWFNLPSVIEAQNRQRKIELATQLGIEFDARSKAEVIHDLRSSGIDAVPSIFPQGLLKKQTDGTMVSVISMNGVEVLPLASIAYKLTVVCNESGQFLTYTSDEHGFNNPQHLWKTAPMDVIVLGDSFVQGWCISPRDNFVSLVRRSHPATLNLGIEGDGPLTMLATLKEYAEPLKPKVVLWVYFEGNDLPDLRDERQSLLLRKYLTNGFSQGLLARQAEIDRALTGYIEKFEDRNKLLTKLEEISSIVTNPGQLPNGMQGIMKLSELRKRLGLIQGNEAKSVAENDRPFSDDKRARSMSDLTNLLQEILLEAKKSVSTSGGTLYFVYLPSRYRYDPTGAGPQPDRDRVLQVATTVGLPIIDIHEIFKVQQDPMSLFPLRVADHYNGEGHRLVASEILRSISVAP